MDRLWESMRFLTILPAPGPSSNKSNDLAKAMVFFPLIGILISVVTLWLFAWLQPFFSPRVANLILLMVPLAVSGGLHLDGFADFCDGFFSGKNKTETLRIMKDPRIGTWGVAGVVLLLLAKFELLQDLPVKALTFALALTAGRWAQVVLSYFLSYARPEGGLGQTVARRVSVYDLAGATFFLFLVILPLHWIGFFVFAALAAFLALLGFYFQKKIGGITGDLLGAASELTELFVFLAMTFISQRAVNL